MKEGMQRWLVSSFIIADELPVPGVREILRQHWILAGGQSTADRFDSPLSGLTSLATSFHCQNQPSPETESEPTGLGQSKEQIF